MKLGVVSDFLYPIAVAVSAITTFLTPYLIRLSDPVANRMAAAMPAPVANVLGLYTTWLRSIRCTGQRAALAAIVQRSLLQVLVNFCFVTAIFLGGAFVAEHGDATWLGGSGHMRNAVIWGVALLLSIPFLIAAYRKLQALSMLLAEVSVGPAVAGRYTDGVRRVVSGIIPVASIVAMLLLVSA